MIEIVGYVAVALLAYMTDAYLLDFIRISEQKQPLLSSTSRPRFKDTLRPSFRRRIFRRLKKLRSMGY
jgi:hypothetical protein